MRDNWSSTETEDYPESSRDRPPSGGPHWSPGSVIAGRYRIVSLLGRGGMGEVYRAEDLELSETVALKFLSEEWADSPERLDRLRQEVKLSRRVTHASVCRVFDLAAAEGRTFISMEWVDGEDLASLLRRIGHLPQAKTLDVAHQLCIGLAAAHSAGILHRDLKPANVMIDSQGRVRIMDFGLALESSPDSLGDLRDGTPAYMSPEQLRGEEVSERSDLFSLGVLLYELTTGKRPFDAETLRTREGAQYRLAERTDGLDPAFGATIDRCLSIEPAARPASALSLLAQLPQGDALAAAVAVGETPSPELVAAARPRATCSRKRAHALLAAWVTYLALEPSLRRRQPKILVSWTRLLAGRFADPLVARDILVGATLGLSATTIALIAEFSSMQSGRFTPVNDDLWIASVASVRGTIETLDSLLFHTVANSLGVAFLFLLFHLLVRRRLPAMLLHGAFFALLSLAAFGTVANPWYYLIALVFACTMTLLLVRVGLLSLVAFWYFVFLATKFPLTIDLTTWYLPSALLTWILVLAPAIWGYRCLTTSDREVAPRSQL